MASRVSNFQIFVNAYWTNVLLFIVQFPNPNVDRQRYGNRRAPCNGHFSLSGTAGLRKSVYGNGFTVMERISLSGTLLMSAN